MGNFFGSTQIRSDSMEKVKDVVKMLCQKEEFECYLSPSINGWVGVYNDMNGQVPLGETLSEHFQEDILSLLVHDDDVFCYWYYKDGKLVDRYNSCPDYFGEDSGEEPGGNPKVFLNLVEKKKIKQIEEILALKEAEDKADHPPEVKKIMAKAMGFKKQLERLTKNPAEFFDFAKKNNIPFEEPLKKLMADLVSKGMSLDQARQYIIDNPVMAQHIYAPIFELFVKQYSSGVSDFHEEEQIELPKRKQTQYPFAGFQLRDFAEVLNIKNTLTCYEYLQQGETDDIVNWEQFIKLPE